MMLDKNLLFSDVQDLAQTAATYLSSKSVDMGTAGTIPGLGGTPVHDWGRGNNLLVYCQVVVAFTSGGSATVQAQLIQADDEALTSNVQILDTTQAIAVATLVAGYQFRFGSLAPGITKRYLGMQYVIATATTTAGKVTSGLVWNKQTNPAVA
jgi:hypothetical protein